jgi:hypothetical protein
MYQSFARELVHVFGQEWYDALVACAARHLQDSAADHACKGRPV